MFTVKVCKREMPVGVYKRKMEGKDQITVDKKEKKGNEWVDGWMNGHIGRRQRGNMRKLEEAVENEDKNDNKKEESDKSAVGWMMILKRRRRRKRKE